MRYDQEVLRLVDQPRSEFDLPIDSVTLTTVPGNLLAENEDYLGEYGLTLKQHGLDVKQIGQIDGYPLLNTGSITATLTQFDPITHLEAHLIVVSPGGGSGKFGVAVTEIAHKLMAGHNPNFIKFETFPVFNLDQTHPLNTAFLAATADLPNDLSVTITGKTNYVKDDENLAILKSLLGHFPHINSPLHNFNEPTDMGVNVIEQGIENEEAVREKYV